LLPCRFFENGEKEVTRLLLGILLYAAALSASAFDSWEHKRLSDLAYHLAVEIHCPYEATAEMCDELRPETSVDVSKDGNLAVWCRTDTTETEHDAAIKKSLCIRLRSLTKPIPRDLYKKSVLFRDCDGVSKRQPVCDKVQALLETSGTAAPVLYAGHKEVLIWCNTNRRDPLCRAVKDNLEDEARSMRVITNGCFKLGAQDKCKYAVPKAAERLTWASFFDPLARDSVEVSRNAAQIVQAKPSDPDNAHRFDSNLTYGDVTRCVDYFMTPEKLMAGSETALWYPTENADITSRSHLRERQLYPRQREDLDITVAKRCDDSYLNLEGALSAHVNHTHFQAELLISQRSQHLLALSLHAIEGNRMAALTANAISDHYLQDSFAPGHITTWRSRLTDLAANAYHDARNRKGLFVLVNQDRFEEMMGRGAGGTLYDKIVKLMEFDTRTSKSETAREYFLYADRPHEDCKRMRCVGPDGQREVKSEVRQIQEIGGRLLHKLRKVGADADADADAPSVPCTADSCVFLRGDSDLWKQEQDEQRLLLLLIQVRSVLDVLESTARPDQPNQYTITDSFRQNTWTWRALEEEPKVFGQRWYPPASFLEAKVGPVDYQITQSVKEDEAKYNHQYQMFDSA
jgi:hypothetical protein